jgi:prevent-host-death family protein
MIRASVAETKNKLSALLRCVKAGHTVVITDRDRPVARIVPLRTDDPIQDLIDRGIATRGSNAEASQPYTGPIQLENGGYAGVLDALLQEREEGR